MPEVKEIQIDVTKNDEGQFVGSVREIFEDKISSVTKMDVQQDKNKLEQTLLAVLKEIDYNTNTIVPMLQTKIAAANNVIKKFTDAEKAEADRLLAARDAAIAANAENSEPT